MALTASFLSKMVMNSERRDIFCTAETTKTTGAPSAAGDDQGVDTEWTWIRRHLRVGPGLFLITAGLFRSVDVVVFVFPLALNAKL